MLGTVEVAGDDIFRQVLSWFLLTSLSFEALKLTLERNFKKIIFEDFVFLILPVNPFRKVEQIVDSTPSFQSHV